MKKFDKIMGIALAIVSILSCVAWYFNILTTHLFVAGFVVGIFAMAFAMMETYHYQEYDNQNSSWFWLLYSAAFGFILVGNCYATGSELINEQLGQALMKGLCLAMLPVFGIFFGGIGRIVKGEPFII